MNISLGDKASEKNVQTHKTTLSVRASQEIILISLLEIENLSVPPLLLPHRLSEERTEKRKARDAESVSKRARFPRFQQRALCR